VEIAVEHAFRSPTSTTRPCLFSGDEDFSYAINAVATKVYAVELAGFRSNTSPRLIDVAINSSSLIHLDEITKTDSRTNHNHHSGATTFQPETAGRSHAFKRRRRRPRRVERPALSGERSGAQASCLPFPTTGRQSLE